MITIKCGTEENRGSQYVGSTVTAIRQDMADVLNIADNFQARLGGTPVGDEDEVTVPDGSILEFVKLAGEKGDVSPRAARS